ncbi:prenyltransferase/squalene oxidase repeat-containing protein [Streptomyces sp. B6B3]|uniref:prenyltransferase/squalene oxidase repeat-containing protein n=1 Tax=Streptomyces sp. B6B3 TaxID=3153570 RepID=UPI00325C3F41
MNRPRRRLAALLPAAFLATAALVVLPGTASHADAPPELDDPAAAAASWAVGQLTDGTHAAGDHGLTADIVMGLAATGTAGDAADRATDWLAENAGDYLTRGAPDSDTVFAGGAAKLALVAAIEHRDPGDFGGHDLTGMLLDRLQDDGRFTDAGGTDMSNQFTQSLAVLALGRTGDLPDSAVDFLASTRCADGGYPLSLRRDPNRCTSDTDSTGLAAQALLAAGRTADAAPALDWLEGRQRDDGGFGYNAASDPNSNSTALAVQALTAGGREEAAGDGTTWLLSRQLGCAAAATDRGAVGYLEPVADGMALRATAQAIPALAGQPLGAIDGASATPEPAAIDCSPDDGGSGGAQGGAAAGGASAGGTDGGASGDPTGGASAGGSGGGDGGTSTSGASGGTGDPADASGGSSGGDLGGSGGSGDANGSGDTGWDDASDGLSPDGGLADTGSNVLPLLGGAVALLVLGAAAYLLARRRSSGR